MLHDNDVRSGLVRSVLFGLTLIGLIVILVVLCVVLPMGIGGSPARHESFHGGYHDHRL